MVYEGFIDREFTDYEDYVTTLVYVEPSEDVSFETAVEALCGESSIGTWTDVSTAENLDRDALRPHGFGLEEDRGLARIAYPNELFELDNIPQVLSSIAGNIYGMKVIQNLRVLDIHFPKEMISAHKGPLKGVQGVRDVLGVHDRPLVGTIVKPKVGLKTKDHAKVAYDAWRGGCDIVKDDENLSSQIFNQFEDRVVETLAARDKAEDETGEKKVYMANITAETDVMLERLDYVVENGGRYCMIDVITLGFAPSSIADSFLLDRKI